MEDSSNNAATLDTASTLPSRRRWRGLATLACTAAASIACVRPIEPLPKPPIVTGEQYAMLTPIATEALRIEHPQPSGDVRQVVRVTARELRTGRVLEGRGALVVRPGKALRMVLVGPGGLTALDVWMAGDAFRVAIPSIDRVLSGSRAKAGDALGPLGMLWTALVSPRGSAWVLATHAHVKDGALCPTRDTSALATFSLDAGAFSSSARDEHDGQLRTRTWLRRHEHLLGYVATEDVLLPGGARWPIRAQLRQVDPPVELLVEGETPELVDRATPLPASAFDRPKDRE